MKKAITGEYVQDDSIYMKFSANKTKHIVLMYNISSKITKLSKGKTAQNSAIFVVEGKRKRDDGGGAFFKLYIHKIYFLYLR